MRFLVDEMFGREIARRLSDAEHDAVHVADVGLAGAADADVMAHAAGHDRVVITEDVGDHVPLLEARTASGDVVPPVVIARKQALPAGAGAMAHRLVAGVCAWAEHHPSPYRHVHWLP